MSVRRVAFLRGINVGGHRVSMGELRDLFEALGLEDVATFIASGNVVFTAGAGGDAALERSIEDHLEAALGYAVATFVRDVDHVAELAALDVLPPDDREGFKIHVTFRKEEAGPDVQAALAALETPDDRFRVRGREVFWLRRGGLMDTTIRPADLDAAMGGVPGTMRTLNTLRRIAEKFGG